MISRFVSLLFLTATIGFISGCATNNKAPTADTMNQAHEEHHAEAMAQQAQNDSSKMGTGMGSGENNGMMGSMNKEGMMEMRHQCTEMHKDGRTCDHQTMEKCEGNLSKAQCKNMMAEVKKNERKEKTKK